MMTPRDYHELIVILVTAERDEAGGEGPGCLACGAPGRYQPDGYTCAHDPDCPIDRLLPILRLEEVRAEMLPR